MYFDEGSLISERYRLVRRVAQGGMGTVWSAWHTGLDVACAVKLLHPALAAEPGLVARFEREAKAAAQLHSPHVVQILDYGIFQGTPYIAMEYLEGEDLGQRLGRVGRLSPDETMTILVAVSRALARAHAAGIVHRDLKPDNIFLVRDDEQETVKVLDFGIAKDFAASRPLTCRGLVLGTPAYMSPEQIMGSTELDHRADLWSLAIVTFECLTGGPPLPDLGPMEMAAAILGARMPRPSELVRDLPRAVDGWWRRATALDPAARFTCAREMIDALAVALAPRLPATVRPAPPEELEAPSAPSAAPRERQTTSLAGMVEGWTPPHRAPSSRVLLAAGCVAVLLVAGALTRAVRVAPASAAAGMAAAAVVATGAAAPASAFALVADVPPPELPAVAPAEPSASAAPPPPVPKRPPASTRGQTRPPRLQGRGPGPRYPHF